jgi:rSAM/selenodomain-associated transferase 2
MCMTAISIIVPVLNDRPALSRLLDDLDAIPGLDAQRIVVDGGSDDGSFELAVGRVDVALRSARGRARQLRQGVGAVDGDWIWMLHADTRIDPSAWQALSRCVAQTSVTWGRFDVELDDAHPAFRFIETLMNLRSRLTGICTGDQGIFVRRDLLETIGGIPDQPLMEDIELTKRLRRHARPTCLDTPIRTSARRWRARGIAATVLLMWRLRVQYFFGTSPEVLLRAYRDER